MAHRIRYLDEALAKLASHAGVWQPSAGEIARWCLDHPEMQS